MSDHDTSDYDTEEVTAPMIRGDLPLTFDRETRSYYHIPPGIPDAVEIADTIRITATLCDGPDAHAIRQAGYGEQLDRLVRMLATHAALQVTAAIKDALYGEPS